MRIGESVWRGLCGRQGISKDADSKGGQTLDGAHLSLATMLLFFPRSPRLSLRSSLFLLSRRFDSFMLRTRVAALVRQRRDQLT